jgi:hypothetical protein
MATESIGNEPLSPLNYTDWKGIVPVINHKSRVYQIWVNGNEHFYYRSDARTLNGTLKEFAKVQTDCRVVVLRPGPASCETFGKKRISYDWNLHIVGGIARHVHAQDDSNVWDMYPTITVFIGEGNVELDELQIPKGLTVLDLADLRAQYRRGLQSADKESRGFAAYYLAEVDPDGTENVPAIARLLDDGDVWVRLMAAGALGKLGANATSALPILRKGLNDKEKRIRERFAEVIAQIENAKPDPDNAKRRQETAARIARFVKALPPDARQPLPTTLPTATRPPGR